MSKQSVESILDIDRISLRSVQNGVLEAAVNQGVRGYLKYPGDLLDLFEGCTPVGAFQPAIMQRCDIEKFGGFLLCQTGIDPGFSDIAAENLVSFGHEDPSFVSTFTANSAIKLL